METSRQFARSAANPGGRSEIAAFQSLSSRTELAGTATTADGRGPRATEAGLKWAEERKLSRETLGLLPVGFGTTFFPDAGAKCDAVFFKYADGWKARAISGKHFVASKGFKPSFWNLESVLEASPPEVFITEGEADACALVEAGVPPDRVLSVPSGARARPADDPAEVRGYDYVTDALRAGLNRCNKFVWCGDEDESGHALRADMVRLFGAAKFAFVTWPEGCKDANDMLRADGSDALRELVSEGALPWPVDGIYRIHEIPDPPKLTIWHPGFAEWESKVLLAPRTLSVVTGHPGHGKTQLFQQIWFQVVRDHGVVACIASFETMAKPHIRQQLRTLLSGKLERDMSEDEQRKADEWIADRYLFLAHSESRPTLGWFLDMAEVAVVRHGARVIQVDPWNRLEASRGRDETETEYIGRCLRALHQFARDLNCHVQIVAHPAKMESVRRDKAPMLEDISGSKNWDNMVDQGFVVHRPEIFDGAQRKTEATLYHRKARFEALGYPCKLNLNFDLSAGKYKSTDYQTGYGT